MATTGARLLAARAFSRGVERVTLRTEWENTASQRVALAAGFTREGVQRGGGASRDGSRHDLIVWARLHTDLDRPKKRILPDLPGHSSCGPGQLTDGVVDAAAAGGRTMPMTRTPCARCPTWLPPRCRPQAPDRAAVRSPLRPGGGGLARRASGPTFTIRDAADVVRTPARSASTTGSRRPSRP